MDPDSRSEIPANMFFIMIDEFFEPEFLKSLYADASLAILFDIYIGRIPPHRSVFFSWMLTVFVRDLVKIRSENPPGTTRMSSNISVHCLKPGAFRSIVTDQGDGKCNLVTERTKNNLLFCGHVDVVPALDDGWTIPPFSGAVLGGSVWGRGTTDMKGGCASLLAACHDFIKNPDMNCRCSLPLSAMRRLGGAGIRYLLAQQMIDPCDCLIAEPTPARHPNIGQKGLIQAGITILGRRVTDHCIPL